MPAFRVNREGRQNLSKYKDLHAVTCRPVASGGRFRSVNLQLVTSCPEFPSTRNDNRAAARQGAKSDRRTAFLIPENR
jgi:hypothetical protein